MNKLKKIISLMIVITWIVLNIVSVYKLALYNTILGLILTLVYLMIDISIVNNTIKELEKEKENEHK